jgi:effector-binding domain-containing protein
MRKAIFFTILFLAAAFLLAQEGVVVKDVNPFWYASMDFQGPYEQISVKVGLFMQEFMKQKLPFGGNLFGIYFNSPEQVKPEELKWAIAIPVSKDSVVNAPLKKTEFLFKTVAVALHLGPYETTGKTYDKIFAYIEKNGYKIAGPAFENYLDRDPSKVKPEELRTEIWVPVQKK